MVEIASHHFGKSPREWDLALKNMPPICLSSAPYFSDRPLPFRSSSVPTVVIRRIIDYHSDNINLMASVTAPKSIERIVQQREPNRSKILRFHGNQDITGCLIRCQSEYRLRGSAVHNDEVFVLEVSRNQPGQDSRVRFKGVYQVIGEVESRRDKLQIVSAKWCLPHDYIINCERP